MDEREKEVIRAAHVLKNFCKSRDTCAGCPIRDTGCLYDTPSYWQLPELEAEPEEAPKERRPVEIKTVQSLVDAASKFDKDVNAALAEGWTLVKRYTNAPAGTHRASTLIAELERYDND
ncbi:MAG: hypothetical protein IKZ08_02995 [Bacteroidales bacterium]|nr:hypothetical protein [Bacteroidales bacterium]